MLQALEVFRASRGAGPAAVMCADGATRCGLFLAAHLLVERLGRDHFLDLFHTLKAIKMRRLGAVASVVSHLSVDWAVLLLYFLIFIVSIALPLPPAHSLG